VPSRSRRAFEVVEGALRLAPGPVKSGAKRVAEPFDIVQRASFRRNTGFTGPIPPAVLRARVGVGISVRHFVGTGIQAAHTIAAAVEAQDRSLQDMGLIYDWGCGCGRLLVPLRDRVGANTVLAGSDVDAQAIGWLSGACPDMRLGVNGFEPPLPLADGEADLLISSSILTHLGEDSQDRWLDEVRRVLAPDGLALISVCGHEMHARMRSGEIETRDRALTRRLAGMPDLADAGFIFVDYERTARDERDFPGVTGSYGLAFHSPEYLREHWGAHGLELLGHHAQALNAAQDLVVLRRR
jgi:SAM-dependent methyltransferase